ncbi:Uncharacterized protein Fot_43137 [Forsythia ovata]|uniref:Uncharacterized protein n=1 Tax=Forsythia ovata TaxID=205694 RepID=A0ABD1RN61_9LAMI
MEAENKWKREKQTMLRGFALGVLAQGVSAGRSTGEHIDGSGNFSSNGRAFMNPFLRLNHSHTNLSLEEGLVKSLHTYGTKQWIRHWDLLFSLLSHVDGRNVVII